MATPQPVALDTPITLKVNHDGLTKKFKLPLRDLGASSLEDKLRPLLGVDRNAQLILERYSDSAAAYTTLDKTNASVFKQMYRAAKAKQKLKLRISTIPPEEPEQPKTTPMSATVEDVPEGTGSNEPVRASISVRAPSNDRLRREAGKSVKEEAPPAYAARSVADLLQPPARSGTMYTTYSVGCNNCGQNIPGAHYHCSICDDGDYDLCRKCVEIGVGCYSDDHWLIKRVISDGVVVSSTTERIAPKPKAAKKPDVSRQNLRPSATLCTPGCVACPEPASVRVAPSHLPMPMQALPPFPPPQDCLRTCNNCIEELDQSEFLHCLVCYDFDLCKRCFTKNEHGHHPKHGFLPAVDLAPMPRKVIQLLKPGRDVTHHAICDGCDHAITGVRHKCLDCPDWDYCSKCIRGADVYHAGHRFAPLYEPIKDVVRERAVRATHVGICCDGPLCNSGRGHATKYIDGDRYKCAVCADVDFCANCEASPANTHNKTHPLIKFKTPVRFVSVSTSGEHENGNPMPLMGDRPRRAMVMRPHSTGKTGNATPTDNSLNTNVQTNVHTVADMKQALGKALEKKVVKIEASKVAEAPKVAEEVKVEVQPMQAQPKAEPKPEPELKASFELDTVADGSVVPPNTTFEQTWILRNSGETAWPAGTFVKFVGGDYMGHVDSKHPAGVGELASASESTVCSVALTSGDKHPFTVVLRTPACEGRIISYWRPCTKDGAMFGDRLWCDVEVKAPEVTEESKVQVKVEPEEEEEKPKQTLDESSSNIVESQMIFPKLEKESPAASVCVSKDESISTYLDEEVDDFEVHEQDEWVEGESEEGFLTDEEYDVLDISDEEFLQEQHGKALRK